MNNATELEVEDLKDLDTKSRVVVSKTPAAVTPPQGKAGAATKGANLTKEQLEQVLMVFLYVTVHDEPGVKSHIANSCYRSKSNHNPIHTYNNSKVQRIITLLLDIYEAQLKSHFKA